MDEWDKFKYSTSQHVCENIDDDAIRQLCSHVQMTCRTWWKKGFGRIKQKTWVMCFHYFSTIDMDVITQANITLYWLSDMKEDSWLISMKGRVNLRCSWNARLYTWLVCELMINVYLWPNSRRWCKLASWYGLLFFGMNGILKIVDPHASCTLT